MTKVDCPVCGKTDLADHLAQCPQCNADLECFRLLEALYEEQSTPGVEAEVVRSLSRRVEDIGLLLQRLQDSLHQVQQAAKRRTAMLIVVSVMLMLVSAASAWLLYVRWDTLPERADVMSSAALLAVLTRERPPEQALREAVANAVAGIEHVSQQVAALEQRVAELATQPPALDTKAPSVAASAPEPAFLVHAPRQNESLWRIAQTYYQQGMLYPAILETNPGLGIYLAPDYGHLRLPPKRQSHGWSSPKTPSGFCAIRSRWQTPGRASLRASTAVEMRRPGCKPSTRMHHSNLEPAWWFPYPSKHKI